MIHLLAHAGHDEHGLVAGLLHPITGLDHLLAALAVGVVATQLGNSMRSGGAADRGAAARPAAALVLPGAFVGGMVGGGVLARLGVALPGVEVGIALSLVALGLAIALRRAGPTWAAALGCAVFALFHGHAHLAEYADPDGLAGYAAGLVVATTLLHLGGVGLGTLSRGLGDQPVSDASRPQTHGVVAHATNALRIAGVAVLAFGLFKIGSTIA